MKTKIPHLILAGMLGTAMTSQAAVLYQSDFTGTTLASTGLTQSGSGYWAIDDPNDRLKWGSGGNNRGPAYTISSYGLDPGYKGFQLDATFQHSGSHVRFSLGLVDESFNIAGAGTNAYWLGSGLSGAYGIGFVAAGSLGAAGAVSGIPAGDTLGFNDGTGTGGDVSGSTKLSIDQGDAIQGQEYTLSMTVTEDSWSYSLNGAPASTGTFATDFDISRNFRFAAFAQNALNSYVSNITISAIPEPSSTALLGLGGLVLALRRRRS